MRLIEGIRIAATSKALTPEFPDAKIQELKPNGLM